MRAFPFGARPPRAHQSLGCTSPTQSPAADASPDRFGQIHPQWTTEAQARTQKRSSAPVCPRPLPFVALVDAARGWPCGRRPCDGRPAGLRGLAEGLFWCPASWRGCSWAATLLVTALKQGAGAGGGLLLLGLPWKDGLGGCRRRGPRRAEHVLRVPVISSRRP